MGTGESGCGKTEEQELSRENWTDNSDWVDEDTTNRKKHLNQKIQTTKQGPKVKVNTQILSFTALSL